MRGRGAGTGVYSAPAIPGPQVYSITPATGAHGSTTAVTIKGAYFTSATSAHVDGGVCTGLTVVDASTITCTVPTGSAGAGKSVTVTTPIGTSAANTLWTYT